MSTLYETIKREASNVELETLKLTFMFKGMLWVECPLIYLAYKYWNIFTGEPTPKLGELFKSDENINIMARLLQSYILTTKDIRFVEHLFDERLINEIDFSALVTKLNVQIDDQDHVEDVVVALFKHPKFLLDQSIYNAVKLKYGSLGAKTLIKTTQTKLSSDIKL